MENIVEKTELEILQNRLAKNPNNAEILTKLAFYYLAVKAVEIYRMMTLQVRQAFIW